MGAKAAAADRPGVNLKESAPANVDGPKEVQLFQAATRASKDGVAMMTLTPDLFLRPILQAGAAGRPAGRGRRAAGQGRRERDEAADRQLERRDRPAAGQPRS